MFLPGRAVFINHPVDLLQDVAETTFIVSPADDDDNLVAGRGNLAGLTEFQ